MQTKEAVIGQNHTEWIISDDGDYVKNDSCHDIYKDDYDDVDNIVKYGINV